MEPYLRELDSGSPLELLSDLVVTDRDVDGFLDSMARCCTPTGAWSPPTPGRPSSTRRRRTSWTTSRTSRTAHLPPVPQPHPFPFRGSPARRSACSPGPPSRRGWDDPRRCRALARPGAPSPSCRPRPPMAAGRADRGRHRGRRLRRRSRRDLRAGRELRRLRARTPAAPVPGPRPFVAQPDACAAPSRGAGDERRGPARGGGRRQGARRAGPGLAGAADGRAAPARPPPATPRPLAPQRRGPPADRPCARALLVRDAAGRWHADAAGGTSRALLPARG